MHQTRLDRWLREHFVYETHVYSMRPAAELPPGVKSHELPDAPGRQYRIHYRVRNQRKAAILIARLKADGQMFTTRVVDRSSWFVPFIAPQGRSFSWRIVWTVVLIALALGLTYGAKHAWDNEQFRTRVLESLDILQR